MKERVLAAETFRLFAIFAVIALLSFGLAQCFDTTTASAQPVAQQEHCVKIYDDAYFCFVDSVVADAYGDVERATLAFRNLAHWQQRSGFVLTTNDPTRRALVVYPWDFSLGAMPAPATDGYVVEMFPSTVLAAARLEQLTWDQRAQSFLLPSLGFGHESMLVYRHFATCGGAN